MTFVAGRTAIGYAVASGFAFVAFLLIFSRAKMTDEDIRLLRKEPATVAQNVHQVVVEECIILLLGLSVACFLYFKKDAQKFEPDLVRNLLPPRDNIVAFSPQPAPNGAFHSLLRQKKLDAASEMLRSTPDLAPSCYYAIIISYCKSGDLERAEHWIGVMKARNVEPDMSLAKALVHAYAKACRPEDAAPWLSILVRESADVVSFSVVINAFGRVGNMAKIEEWVDIARSHGLELNKIIYNTIINACSKTADVRRAESWFRQMEAGCVEPDQIMWNTMIKTCARAGDIDRMNYWVTRMKESGHQGNVLTYTSVIQASSKIGDVERGRSALKEMRAIGLWPDVILYNSLLYGCEMSGDIARAEEIVQLMEKDGLKLDRVGHKCVVKALSKGTKNQSDLNYWCGRLQRFGIRNVSSTINARPA